MLLKKVACEYVHHWAVKLSPVLLFKIACTGLNLGYSKVRFLFSVL